MVMTCRGVLRSGNVIELDAPPPYPAGTEVTVELEPGGEEVPAASEEATRRFRALVGRGHSGLRDASRRKHEYLADAYDQQ